MIKAIIFLMAFASFCEANAQGEYINDYNRIFCYLVKDSAVQNHLISIVDSDAAVEKWNGKFKINSSLFALQIFPFSDVLNKNLNSEQIHELLNVLNASFENINTNSFKCRGYKSSPFEVSFSDKKYNLIEVDIEYLMTKQRKDGTFFRLSSGESLHVLYKIKENTIINLATRKITE